MNDDLLKMLLKKPSKFDIRQRNLQNVNNEINAVSSFLP